MCFKCPHSLSLARNPILGNFFHNAFPIPPKVLPEPQGYHCQYSLSRSAFLSEEIKVAPLAQCQALNWGFGRGAHGHDTWFPGTTGTYNPHLKAAAPRYAPGAWERPHQPPLFLFQTPRLRLMAVWWNGLPDGYTPIDNWTKRQAGDTDGQVPPPWSRPSTVKVVQEMPESKERWQVWSPVTARSLPSLHWLSEARTPGRGGGVGLPSETLYRPETWTYGPRPGTQGPKLKDIRWVLGGEGLD